MNSREHIRKIILDFENNHPVNDWYINGIMIWPYLRIRLFFSLRREFNEKKDQVLDQKKSKKKIKHNFSHILILKTSIKYFYNFIKKTYKTFKLFLFQKNKISSLPKKDFIFLGANSHRINFQGHRFNRYFDTYILDNKIENNYIFYEYDDSTNEHIFKPENIVRFNDVEKLINQSYSLKIKKNKNKLNQYDTFFDDLKSNKFTSGFSSNFEKDKIITQIDYIHNLSNFFRRALKQINPEKIYILCYYSTNVFAFVHAANKLGIETIEMQHGAQTKTHLAYGSWSKVPKGGYDLIPKTFWHWNEDSSKTIKSWSNGISNIKSIVVGNPWANYWSNKKQNYYTNNFILYSLQPKPYTIEQLFPESIIKLIKNTKFKWFLRFHPRQNNMDNIVEFLCKKKLINYVEIEKASNDPLPVLISNCRLHITNSSGTTMEAELFKKKTILIDEIGKIYYPEIIERGFAKCIIKTEHDFYQQAYDCIEYLSF